MCVCVKHMVYHKIKNDMLYGILEEMYHLYICTSDSYLYPVTDLSLGFQAHLEAFTDCQCQNFTNPFCSTTCLMHYWEQETIMTQSDLSIFQCHCILSMHFAQRMHFYIWFSFTESTSKPGLLYRQANNTLFRPIVYWWKCDQPMYNSNGMSTFHFQMHSVFRHNGASGNQFQWFLEYIEHFSELAYDRSKIIWRKK